MTRSASITFVGPISYCREKNVQGGVGAEFTLVQNGGALKLEYPTMSEAAPARRAILGNAKAHGVPTTILLAAIQEAISLAMQSAPQSLPPGDEPAIIPRRTPKVSSPVLRPSGDQDGE